MSPPQNVPIISPAPFRPSLARTAVTRLESMNREAPSRPGTATEQQVVSGPARENTSPLPTWYPPLRKRSHAYLGITNPGRIFNENEVLCAKSKPATQPPRSTFQAPVPAGTPQAFPKRPWQDPRADSGSSSQRPWKEPRMDSGTSTPPSGQKDRRDVSGSREAAHSCKGPSGRADE